MSKKLKIALRRSSSEQGFAIPIVVGMGLVMLLVGVTMIVRSQGDQVTASAQKATADSLGVAETGVTRILALLKQYPSLASQPRTAWGDTTVTSAARCNGTNLVNGTNLDLAAGSPDAKLINRSKQQWWLNVDDADSNAGEFRVFNYAPTGGIGTLTIEGRAKSENAAATETSSTATKLGNSTTSLEVQIPLTSSASGNAGIWVKRNTAGDPIDVSNNISINADVQVEGCSFDPAKINTNKLEHTNGNTALPIKAIYDGTIPGVGTSLKAFPSLPTMLTGTRPLPRIDASNCIIRLPRISTRPNLGVGTTCVGPDQFGVAMTTTFGNGNEDPYITDTNGNLVYSYLIDSTTTNATNIGQVLTSTGASGGDSIKLSNSILVIDPPAGKKVILYVRGNMNLSGTSLPTGGTQMACAGTTTPVTTYINGGTASNLEIYASDGTGTYGSGYKTDTITFSDTVIIKAFIYAPMSLVSVSQGQIEGVVWAQRFAASNNPTGSGGCDAGVIQASLGNVSVTSSSSTVSSISSWKHREAN